jgi:hypothetical protein
MNASRLIMADILGLIALTAAVGCSQSHNATNSGAPVGASPMVVQGYMAVQSRQCGKCHQSANPADGILSGQTTPVPDSQSYGSNLTPDPDTGMDSWDAGDIAQAVLNGLDNQGATLCPEMPREADAGMGQDEALAIAAYLQSLTPEWHVVPASACQKPTAAGDGGAKGDGG